MQKTDEQWRAVGWDVLMLLDAFYHARIDRPSADRSDPTSERTFPQAQLILADDGAASLFKRVQRELGLLQTVILYGLPMDSPSPRFVHLDTTLRLKVPWLAVTPGLAEGTTWQVEPETRAEALGRVFTKFREDSKYGVQEFAHLLGTAGSGPRPSRPGLSAFEHQTNYLLVEDEEMSFFSLLFVLLEARDDAASLAGMKRWSEHDSSRKLRSVLRLSDLDGPPKDAAFARSLPNTWNDHYWEAATFSDAMAALGFMSDGVSTCRFERMCRWLEEPDEHIALRTMKVRRRGEDLALSEVVRSAVPAAKTAGEPIEALCFIASRIAEALEDASFSDPGEEQPARSDVLRSPGRVRFNLPGEYLLRRDESISRAFFATPLTTVRLPGPDGTYATAFALGTLLDFSPADADMTKRLAILRQVLSAIADFGLSHRITELAIRLELTRSEGERVRWIRHVVFTALAKLRGAITDALNPTADSESYQRVYNRYDGVYTLCEYVTGKTRPETAWSNSLHEMLNKLQEWFNTPDTTVLLDLRGLDAVYDNNVSRALAIVLLNLMDNAYKCADKGGTVALLANTEPDTSNITVTIHNTGLVMDSKFANYLRGTVNAVPRQGNRECEGLQTIRYVLREELHLGFPIVESPFLPDHTGTRISFTLPSVLPLQEVLHESHR